MSHGFLCSWCGMSDREVEIVAGPCVYICRTCHGLVGDIFSAGLQPIPDAMTIALTSTGEDFVATEHPAVTLLANAVLDGGELRFVDLRQDKRETLTDRQRAVLDHIRSKITEQGYAPTLREIGEALGMKSTNGVQDHVKALEKKGYIRRTYGTARSIVLTEPVSR